MNEPNEMTFQDAIYLLQAAFIRSGALMDLDRILDEKDPVKRIFLVVSVLKQSINNDTNIQNVMKKTNMGAILKKEAMARQALITAATLETKAAENQ